MESNRLNQWLTLGANIGVLVGIILLLVELNQTQEIARAEIRNEIYQGLTDSLDLMDRDTADIIARLKAGDVISQADAILVDRWAESIFRYWENADYQYLMGLYDESEYTRQQVIIRQVITEFFPELLVTHYCMTSGGYSGHFKDMLDQFITPDMCDRYKGFAI